ncbi:hypothetical protein GWK47_034292 [Chionoecetes opilio]|uniref:Uncharacterized protein n=1 Tax=Chionoecetes opilio TaxID=41210 RepID=A0A8J5D3N4_CHIOP|nr:hypothetical protein GWK47_034292 [Chionoecetes opilio]
MSLKGKRARAIIWNVSSTTSPQLIPEAERTQTTVLSHYRERNDRPTRHSYQPTAEHRPPGGKEASHLSPDKTKPPHLRRQGANWTKKALPWRRKYTPRGRPNILGVEFDSGPHIHQPRQKVPRMLPGKRAVRRLRTPGRSGIGTLYKSQIPSLIENSPLAWSSCPPVIPVISLYRVLAKPAAGAPG